MQRIQTYLENKNCDYLELEVLTINTSAYHLYQELGYEDQFQLINMIKKLT